MKTSKLITLILLLILCALMIMACDTANNASSNAGSSSEDLIIRPDPDQDANESNSESDGEQDGTQEPDNVDTTISVIDAFPFSDGIATVTILESKTIEGNTSSEEYRALIDTSGNILHKFTDDELQGVPLIYEFRYHNGVTYNEYNNTIYDKNYNVIASPESKGYDAIVPSEWLYNKPYAHDCGYFLVYKTEEAFTGDKVFAGVLDVNGNYTVPLSDTHPIAAVMAEKNCTFSTIEIEYVGNGYYGITFDGNWTPDCYYNIISNKITSSYPHFENDYYVEGEYYGFVKIDETGNATKITPPEGELRHVQGDYYLCSSESPSMYNDYVYSDVKLIDIVTNSVLIDFGEYRLKGSDYENGTYYLNGYFLTTVKNAQGASYVCLFDNSGEPVFEPVRLSDNYSDQHYELTEDGFIIKKDGVFYFYDYEGEVASYDPQSQGVTVKGYNNGWLLIRVSTGDGNYEDRFINSKGQSMY